MQKETVGQFSNLIRSVHLVGLVEGSFWIPEMGELISVYSYIAT